MPASAAPFALPAAGEARRTDQPAEEAERAARTTARLATGPVLIATPTGRDGALASAVLWKAAIANRVCADLGELTAAIGAEAGAVLLAEEALRGAALDAFLGKLRTQEPWSDLPVLLLLASRASPAHSAALVARLAPATFVTLLERPLAAGTLVSMVEAALRARQRQWEVRALLAERERIAESLHAAKHQAEAASAAKDHFLAALSHELRTPLSPVLMILSDRSQDPALPADVREELAIACRNVRLEARLIDDLLDLTRIARGKIELQRTAFDVHDVLRDALAICTADGTARRLQIALEPRAAASRVEADRARLQQVFWNLISNAVKFTPEGGSVTLATHNHAPGWLGIEVRDTGIGIAPGKTAHLFDAFEQGGRAITKRYGGLGLGLAISKAIVELHGGRIHAHSAGEGRGATFTVELPVPASAP